MLPSEACMGQRSAGDQRMRGHPPDRPPCCCESRCTCPHCHGGDRRCPSHHHHHPPPPPQVFPHDRGGCSLAGRRCTSCVPEQEDLMEVDLLARRRRCEEARVAERLRRTALANSVGRHGRSRFYTSNTAELLRRQNNVACQAAVDAEYDARRRTLQAELDARRDEIAALQRAREELRMEAAFCGTDLARRGGSPRRLRSSDRARPPSPSPYHARSPGGPWPPPPPPPQAEPASQPPPLNGEDGTPREAPQGRRLHSCGDRTPPPLRHHRHNDWGSEQGPCGSWGHDWECCAPPASPPPPRRSERRAPSSWQYSKRPSPPPPPHKGDKCPPPPPPPPQLACFPHHSPHPAGGAAACSACPSCGHALMSARDVVSMIAAGMLESSVACPACGFVGGILRCPAAHRCAPSPHGGRSDGSDRDGARHGHSCGPGLRSRSAASSPLFSSTHLTGPKFGRKVYVTDDLYRDRRARYLAEWEARGTVRRMPPSHRSPSAPLPERTPKWLTTGSGSFTD